MDRNAIYDALFAIGSGVSWGELGETWSYTSQRLDIWTECPAQPAFYQVAHNNTFQQVSGMPYRVELRATWVVYQDTATDKSVVGSRLNNTLLDAFQAALAPFGDEAPRPRPSESRSGFDTRQRAFADRCVVVGHRRDQATLAEAAKRMQKVEGVEAGQR